MPGRTEVEAHESSKTSGRLRERLAGHTEEVRVAERGRSQWLTAGQLLVALTVAGSAMIAGSSATVAQNSASAEVAASPTAPPGAQATLSPASQPDAQAATDTDGHDELATAKQSRETAAEWGVEEGAWLAQLQGATVTQAQIQAAKAAAVGVVHQHQDADIQQIQRAARGAAHGALVQSQSVNVTQLQASVSGSVGGSLSQSQSANVTQIQGAAYGAAHGSLAQAQRVSVTQVQQAAAGAASGAAKGAAKRKVADVSKIQEAAQGGAYGALERKAKPEKTHGAAKGGAEGALEQTQHANVKQVQVAALGGAKGAVSQSQRATVRQVQAAGHGAAAGAISQSQTVNIVQIQVAAMGAASGALSQSQSASVTQIQSAARGACRGVLGQVTQVQVVNIVQIQIIVQVAAAETTKKAVREKETRPTKIFHDGKQKGKDKYRAPGDSDRDGLSDDQERLISTDPDDVDTDGDNLNDGTEVLVEQTDPRNQDTDGDGLDDGEEVNHGTNPTLADTDRDGIDDGEEVDQGSNPLDPNDPTETDADEDGLTLREERDRGTDPNDDDTDGDGVGDGEEVDSYDSNPLAYDTDSDGLSDGTEAELGTDPTAADTDGDGLTDSAEVERGTDPTDPDDPAPPDPDGDGLGTAQERQIGTDPQDSDTDDDGLDDGREVTVVFTDPTDPDTDNDTLTDGDEVQNDSDPLDVNDPNPIDADDDGLPDEVEAEVGTNVTNPDTDGDGFLDGTEVDDGTDPLDPDDPPRIRSLGVATDCANVTATNTNDVPVSLTVAGPNGTEQVGLAAGETRQVVESAGDYTLTASTGDGTTVPLGEQNESEFAVTVEECPTVAESLTVVERERNVSVTNPNDASVTVTATGEAGAVQNETVPANETTTLPLAPGNYTLTASIEAGEPVSLNGEQTLNVSIETTAPTLPPVGQANLTASVENATLTVTNPSGVDATANLTNETGTVELFAVPPGETETISNLPAGNYTLAATSEGNATAQVNGNESFAFSVQAAEPTTPEPTTAEPTTVESTTVEPTTVEPTTAEPTTSEPTTAEPTMVEPTTPEPTTPDPTTPEPQALDSLTATVEIQSLTVENPNDLAVTVNATNETGANRTLSVLATSNETLAGLAPGNWTATATAEDGRAVPINGSETYNFTVTAPVTPLESLAVVVGNETFSVENPNELGVSVTVTNESGTVGTTPVGPGENVTATGLAPGNYTLNATSEDGRVVPLNGNETLSVELVGSPVDTDSDGLVDEREADLGTNATRADTDGDGLSDGEEADGETDPLLPDTDMDAVTDGAEVANGTDPLNQSDPGFVDPARYGFDPADPGRSIFWVNPAIPAHQVEEPRLIDSEEIERLIHERVNEIRQQNGLDPLRFNDTLASVARAHSEDMAERNFFENVNPDGEGPLDRYQSVVATDGCSAYGENIQGVSGPVTNEQFADAVVSSWMNSSDQRANILDPDWDSEGIGVYFTQDSINDTFVDGEAEGLLGRSQASLLVTQNFCDQTVQPSGTPTSTPTEAPTSTPTETSISTTTSISTEVSTSTTTPTSIEVPTSTITPASTETPTASTSTSTPNATAVDLTPLGDLVPLRAPHG
ncbi:CAP domain-containing protein [Halobacterium zhouii]|uniref:CAP domain-containing protein n=1 Tax=Halobacterium zhouii TaxID=2902624 RepID=UPI001E2B1670|nr:CAP domain-containing protein [Halobacterium zhouii]